MIEIFALPLNNNLAYPENGVLALLDALHQLQRGGESFLDVVADVAVGGIALQQPPIHGR